MIHLWCLENTQGYVERRKEEEDEEEQEGGRNHPVWKRVPISWYNLTRLHYELLVGHNEMQRWEEMWRRGAPQQGRTEQTQCITGNPGPENLKSSFSCKHPR